MEESSPVVDELECRVCRGGAEPDRPLFYPCLCSGSIMFCHQDCLEQWLSHSKKDKCEVCDSKYMFTSVYMNDAPSIVPIYRLLTSGLKIVFVRFIPLILRVSLALSMWLCVVPVITSELYRMTIGRGRIMISYDMLYHDVISGLVLTGTIVLAFLVMMSFIDFLRFNWDLNNLEPHPRAPGAVPPRRQRNNNRAHRRAFPRPVARRAAVPNNLRNHFPAVNAGGDNADIVPPHNPVAARRLSLNRKVRKIDDNAASGENTCEFRGFDVPTSFGTDDDGRFGLRRTEMKFGTALGGAHAAKDEQSIVLPSTVDVDDRSENLSDCSSSRRSIPLTETQSSRACAGSEVSTDIDNDMKNGVGDIRLDAINKVDSDDWLEVKSQTEMLSTSTVEIETSFSKLSNSFAFLEQSSNPTQVLGSDTSLVNSDPFRTDPTRVLRIEVPDVASADNIFDSGSKSKSISPKRDLNISDFGEELMSNDESEIDYTKLSGNFAISESAAVRIGRREPFLNDPEGMKALQCALDGGLIEVNSKSEEDYLNSEPWQRSDQELGLDLGIADGAGDPDIRVMGDHLDLPAVPNLPADIDPGNEADFQVNLNFLGDIDDQPPADIEIHLILDEFIGIRAPVVNILMNASWLLLFNCLFIIIFGLFPYLLGSSVYSFFSNFFSSSFQSFFCTDAESTCMIDPIFMKFSFYEATLLVNTIHEESLKTDSIVKPIDISYILFGYTIAALFFLFLGNFIMMAYSLNPNVLSATTNRRVGMITSIVKVGFFLFVRIFCLPVVLGTIFLLILNIQTQYTTNQIVLFIAKDIVSFIYLSWASGISYMLTVTLSVLQLREVLHPRILANIIRSHEPHNTLLISLIVDSIPTHIRRIIISMIVYVVFLFLFVMLPLCAVNSLIPSPTPLEVWYGVPELQLPFELVLSHVIFLAVVDAKKDSFGLWQHQWFVFISKVFGMQRFILPILKESDEEIYRGEVGSAVELARVTEPDCHGNLNKDIIIARPPEGWETRDSTQSSRWAWIEEPKSRLESSLSPITIPSMWRLKLFLVVILSWLLTVLLIFFVAFAPLIIGRGVQSALRVPVNLRHDPISLVLGYLVLKSATNIVNALGTANFRYLPSTRFVRICYPLSRTMFQFGFLIPTVIGLCFHLSYLAFTDDAALHLTAVSIFQDWVLGDLLLSSFLILLNFRFFEYIENSLGVKYSFIERFHRGVEAIRNLTVTLRSEAFTEESMLEQLADANETIISPLLNYWLNLLALIFFCSILGVCFHFGSMYLFNSCFASYDVLAFLGARWGSCIAMTSPLYIALVSPARTCIIDFHNMIRDELYLIGKKLENFEARKMDAPPTTL